jgi:hypothetical protein
VAGTKGAVGTGGAPGAGRYRGTVGDDPEREPGKAPADEAPAGKAPADEAPAGEAPEAPLRFDDWRRRSATGVVMTGIALGFREALELPDQRPALVIEAPGGPGDPDRPIDLHFDPDDPSATVAVVRRPNATATGDQSEPPEEREPGDQPEAGEEREGGAGPARRR